MGLFEASQRAGGSGRSQPGRLPYVSRAEVNTVRDGSVRLESVHLRSGRNPPEPSLPNARFVNPLRSFLPPLCRLPTLRRLHTQHPRPLVVACGWWLSACSIAAAQDVSEIPPPDPDAEMAAMNVHPSLAINLFASDPDIAKPVQMNFDDEGKLWVATSETYPQVIPGSPANDKIVTLADTDGDGVADRTTVFADGLLIPTGVIPDSPDSAYVVDSTQLLHLSDTDGDGRADHREVILSGFGTEDTHHLLHTLRWGPDGHLYFNQSIYIHSHLDTPLGTRHLDGGGIWRFHPPSGRLEIFCKGFINPWGHVFDAAGESFVTDGAFFEGINYTFPDAVFVTSPGATRWLSGLNPGSPKHCGLEIVSGTHLPSTWNGSLITNDFRSHRVCRFEVRPDGSAFQSRQQPELVTSSRVTFRPIDARMGPEGGLYIADWYNPIIQHGEVDFRDPRRDRKHGRIWRLTAKGRPLDRWPKLSDMPIDQMVPLLRDDSLAVRMHVRRELWRRCGYGPYRSVAPESDTLVSIREALDRWVDADPHDRMTERLWLDDAVGNVRPENFAMALELVEDMQPSVARLTLRAMWRATSALPAEERSVVRAPLHAATLAACRDHRAAVRLEAVTWAKHIGGRESLSAVLHASAMDTDPFLDFAIWQAFRNITERDDAETWVADIAEDSPPRSLSSLLRAAADPNLTSAVFDVLESSGRLETMAKATEAPSGATASLFSAIAETGSPETLGRLTRAIFEMSPASRWSALTRPILDRTDQDKTVPNGVRPLIATTVTTAPPAGRGALVAMAARYGVIDPVREVMSNIESLLPRDRQRVIESVAGMKDPVVLDALTKLASATEGTLAATSIRSLAIARPSTAAKIAMDRLRGGESPITTVVADLLGRPAFASALQETLQPGSLDTDAASNLLAACRGVASDELISRIRTAGDLSTEGYQWNDETLSRLLQAGRGGDPAVGQTIYRRAELQCTNCHGIGGTGGGPRAVGPNLISLGGSAQMDYIIESLITPSAKLKEGYSTSQVLTVDGEAISGIRAGENDSTITLRTADGSLRTIAKDDIEFEQPGKSLMPAGLVDNLTAVEMGHLVAFLSALGKDPAWTVSTDTVLRDFETLIYSPEANRRLNRTSTDTVAKADPLMRWRSTTSRVDGTLAVEELDAFQQHRQTPPTSFIRFAVDVGPSGKIDLEFASEGIDAWLDGKPTPVWELRDAKVSPGVHRIVLAMDRNRVGQGAPLKIHFGGDAVPAAIGMEANP